MLAFVLRRIARAAPVMLAIDRFLHSASYDFNDEIIPPGAGCLAALVEESRPIK